MFSRSASWAQITNQDLTQLPGSTGLKSAGSFPYLLSIVPIKRKVLSIVHAWAPHVIQLAPTAGSNDE